MNIFKQLIAVTFLSLALPAVAGSTQELEHSHPIGEIENFAKSVEKFAAKHGARAFIIARKGRPQEDMPEGISFTHTAIAVYSAIELATGEIVNGYAIHNLYQKADERDKSVLITDYPVDFFWGAQVLEAGVIIPAQTVQQRIIEVIAQGKDKTLHNPNYSVIANPMNNELQNCTEYTLNIINAGIYQTTDLAQLKQNTKAYFTPQKVKVSGFKLLMGSLFVDDVTTKDHQGKIYTTTFKSIARYLKENELIEQAMVLNAKGETKALL